MVQRPDVTERHRRQREQTRRRILDRTRELVEEYPWNEISIGLVTESAGLTRTALYKHFADRRELLMALFTELSEELAAAPAAWITDPATEDSRPLLEAAVDTLVDVFVRHGRLLEAVAEEAAADPSVGEAYEQFGSRLSEAVAARIEQAVAHGRSTVADPVETATALVWMNERYLRLRFGRPPLGDRQRAAAALRGIWLGVIYGSWPGPSDDL